MAEGGPRPAAASGPRRPATEIDGCRRAHVRLLATLDGVDEAAARAPSHLDGWTVGHLLTHLARNADSHVRMLEAAGRGEIADQYDGGRPRRAADIEAGAGRPAAALVDDVVASVDRLEAAWDATGDDVWSSGRSRRAGGEIVVVELPFWRWREVELHHADLGLGFGPDDWSADYVVDELGRSTAALAARLPDGTALRLVATDAPWSAAGGVPAGPTTEVAEVAELAAPARRLLAWLVGRAQEPAWPALSSWEGTQAGRREIPAA